MTVITMPDGQAVDFGDMPPAQIKALIEKRYPEAARAAQPPARPPEEPYSGQILPFSKDAQGNVSFDIHAGLPGMIARGAEMLRQGAPDARSDQGIAALTDAAMVASPVSAASRGGLGWAGAPISRRTTAVTPTATELKATGGFGFDMARQMDVRYVPKSVQNMAMKLQSQLFKDGFRARDGSAPTTFAEIQGILRSNDPGAFVSIDDLHSVRQALQGIPRTPDRAKDREAANRVIQAIDEFITSPNPADIVAGPVAGGTSPSGTLAPFSKSTAGAAQANAYSKAVEAGKTWKESLGNYAAGKRSQRLTGLEDDAELQAIATNSGLNIDNKIRQLSALIVRRPDLRAGFSEEEIANLRNVAGEGAKARNALRYAANLLGGGGGLGALITGGVSTGLTGMTAPAVVGAAAIGVGLGAKVAANKITKSALGSVDDAVRQRSPLYEQRLATSPTTGPYNPAARSAGGRFAAGSRGGGSPPEAPQMTPEMYDEYLRQKWALRQGA